METLYKVGFGVDAPEEVSEVDLSDLTVDHRVNLQWLPCHHRKQHLLGTS